MTEGILPPADDADVPRYWRELGLPGLVDVHVHFLPERVQAKVWQYFADAESHYGRAWPIGRPSTPERGMSTHPAGQSSPTTNRKRSRLVCRSHRCPANRSGSLSGSPVAILPGMISWLT